MTSLSLTSLICPTSVHVQNFTNVQYMAGQRGIRLSLLSLLAVTDGEVFTLPFFSITSVRVEKLAR